MRADTNPMRPQNAEEGNDQPSTDPTPKGAGTLEEEVQPPAPLNAEPETDQPSSGTGTKGHGTLEEEVGLGGRD